MDMITLIGLGAAFCTTAAFIPQVLQILKTGNVDGISLGMYSTFTLGVAMWFSYGIMLSNIPMILANLVTLALAGSVLFLTVRSRMAAKKVIDIVEPAACTLGMNISEVMVPECVANDSTLFETDMAKAAA